MTLGESLRKCIFRTETVILWKSDNPVSISPLVSKKRGLLVRIKSIQPGFSGFLKHVVCLMRLCKEQNLQNVCKASSSARVLKLPRRTIFSYLVESASIGLLMILSSFPVLLLWGLLGQLISHLFLYRLISIKQLSAEGKSWLNNLAGIPSHT